MEERYNVYFAAVLLDGHEPAAVREKLAKLFNADDSTLDKLFSGKPMLLKRDCDKATALKYQQAMERAGAQAIVKSSEPTTQQPAAAPAPQANMSAAQRIAALAGAPDEDAYRYSNTDPEQQQDEATDAQGGLNLAPGGSDVLREDERAAPVVQEIDTSELEIDAQAQRLSEPAPPSPAAPDTSHLQMGEAGEQIPNLPAQETPLSPNTDAIDLSPQGTDFSDCAAPEATAPQLDLSDMELAAAGTDVLEEKYRQHEEVEPPSTEHLAIDDQDTAD